MWFLQEEFRFPSELSEALCRALWKEAQPSARALDDAGSSLRELWPRLAIKRGQEIKHYSFHEDSARAYAAYYLPANLMKVPCILEEMRRMGLAFSPTKPLRWLDFGCGPGTALWGLAWWASQLGVDIEYVGVDQSREFTALGAALSRELFSGLSNAVAASAEWKTFKNVRGDFVEEIRARDPDVVSFMNSVGEIFLDPAERAERVGELIACLSQCAQKDMRPRFLILIEPGSQVASRELLELRESLRARGEKTGDTRIWLPCLDARPCGALAKPGDWCHEEAACRFPPWHERLGERAGLRKEALLFSYLVCSVGAHPAAPSAWPSGGKRVVSQRLEEKGLTRCFLCTREGKTGARVIHSRAKHSRDSARMEKFKNTCRGRIYTEILLSEKGDVQEFKEYEGETEEDATVFPKPQ